MVGETVERELQVIAQFASVYLSSTTSSEVGEAMRDLFRFLPMRTVNEIKLVLQLIEGTPDERIQQACAATIEYAMPKMPEVWMALESGMQSQVKVLHTAVEARLRLRKRENEK